MIISFRSAKFLKRVVIMPPPHGAQPLWMKNLLQANFYGDNDTCDIEGHRWKTVFCKSCMDGPICGKCCRDLHENHDVLQVCFVLISTY